MTIARVALDVPVDTLFEYLAGPATTADLGRRVVVPLGRREVVGVLHSLSRDETSQHPLKPIGRVMEDVQPLDDATMRLLAFCARYYHHPLGSAIIATLPRRLRRVPTLKRSSKATHAKGSTRQSGGATGEPDSASLNPSVSPTLTTEQERVVQTICTAQDGFRPWLLLGITGSGKTEIFLRALQQTLSRGRQVLYLVPEINLTPQLEAFLRDRVTGARLTSLHSGLAEGERCRNWIAAQRGEANIVLGTRLAVFTPMPKLGLIVVDEEHDGSFKQMEGMRYCARDVAVMRAKKAAIPIILGSATPALESFAQALAGKYSLLRLGARPRSRLPQIVIVDTNREPLEEGLGVTALGEIRARLDRGEQSLIFVNRRGYAPALYCRDCRWLANCRRCSAHLVVHLRHRRLTCHLCGHSTALPRDCPVCGNQDLAPIGQGTQRVEQFLTARFPDARVLRVDRDSTRGKRTWAGMRDEIAAEQIDILVGTQMLAKGHDFPKLTLVIAVNADGALFSTDFRAAERLFAQLTQVAGRAGRGSLPGQVLIQTDFPHHPVFRAVAAQDYEGFARAQLTDRQRAGFPPYSYQALLRAEATQESTVMNFLERAAIEGRSLGFDAVDIYDPVPALKSRIAGRDRAQLLLQSRSRMRLQAFLDAWYPSLGSLAGRKVKWVVDVDPLDL